MTSTEHLRRQLAKLEEEITQAKNLGNSHLAGILIRQANKISARIDSLNK